MPSSPEFMWVVTITKVNCFFDLEQAEAFAEYKEHESDTTVLFHEVLLTYERGSDVERDPEVLGDGVVPWGNATYRISKVEQDPLSFS